jgi:ATP-binding cassette subfamily C (CFTR/MRP) protein 1
VLKKVAYCSLLHSWALWRAIAHAYGRPYAGAAALKLLQDLLAFAQPQFLRLLLAYITAYQTDNKLTKFQGFALTALMFIAALIQTAILHQVRCAGYIQLISRSCTHNSISTIAS